MIVYLVLPDEQPDERTTPVRQVSNWLTGGVRVFSSRRKAEKYLGDIAAKFAAQPGSPRILGQIVEHEVNSGLADEVVAVVEGRCRVDDPAYRHAVGGLALRKTFRAGRGFPLGVRRRVSARATVTLHLEALSAKEIYDFLCEGYGRPSSCPHGFGL